MGWTYSGDPSVSRKDEVRFLVGDTNNDPDEQLLQDEEILYALRLYPVASDTATYTDPRSQPLMASLVCAEAIWAYFQRQADERLPPVNFEYAARAKNYKAKIDYLQNTIAKRGGLVPYVGGVSIIDKLANKVDYDTTHPDFYRGEFDNNSTIANTQQNLLGLD